jgi:hypothetical protein
VRLIAGGCSFVWGNELSDVGEHAAQPSRLSFSALLAQQHGLEYWCCAVPGGGNDTAVRQVIESEPVQGDIVLVNWTFDNRHEFYFTGEGWRNIIPSKNTFCKEFFTNLQSEYSVYHTVKNMVFLSNYLDKKGVPYIYTFADMKLNYRTDASRILADEIDATRCFRWSEDVNFQGWAVKQGYAIGPGSHPLDAAHAKSAELINPLFSRILNDVHL